MKGLPRKPLKIAVAAFYDSYEPSLVPDHNVKLPKTTSQSEQQLVIIKSKIHQKEHME